MHHLIADGKEHLITSKHSSLRYVITRSDEDIIVDINLIKTGYRSRGKGYATELLRIFSESLRHQGLTPASIIAVVIGTASKKLMYRVFGEPATVILLGEKYDMLAEAYEYDRILEHLKNSSVELNFVFK